MAKKRRSNPIRSEVGGDGTLNDAARTGRAMGSGATIESADGTEPMWRLAVRRALPHLAAVAFYYALVGIYFQPSVFEGKSVRQPDIEQSIGMSQDMREAAEKAESGEVLAWTGALFSGMPNYVIYTHGFAPNYTRWIDGWVKALDRLAGSAVLTGLLSFHILMISLGARAPLAAVGAVAFAFASYNLIILEAGHVNKAYVIALMPLTVAGMLRLFERKWLSGFMLYLLGVTLSVSNYHPQITYYLVLLCATLFAAYLAREIRGRRWDPLGRTTALLALGGVLAVLPSIGSLFSTWEMGRTSLRGPSELTITPQGERQAPGEGLDRDYAFMWSYGAGELLTVLVPNAYGGGSGGTLDSGSALHRQLTSRGARIGSTVQTYTYWGDKPFTSGPVYFGAVVCFLFVFAMAYLRERMRWAFLAGAVFLTLLALGRNFMAFNALMFEWLPLYDKFRTPEMSLVIPGLVAPLVGFWGLHRFLSGIPGRTARERADEQGRFRKALYIALGIAGGLSALVWLLPDLLLEFRSPGDGRYEMPAWYYAALVADRADLARADALRSLLFIAAAAGALLGFARWRDTPRAVLYATLAIGVLVLADLWSVGRRYLDESNFVPTRPDQSFSLTAADRAILSQARAEGDEERAYRVLNLNGTFSDNQTPYFHRSVGGYHPAKLRSYQDLMDFHLNAEINRVVFWLQSLSPESDPVQIFSQTPVLNLLNTRYVIYSPEEPPLENPYAFGEAWFVDRVQLVPGADEEILALASDSLRQVAYVRQSERALVEGLTSERGPASSEPASIELTSYKPHRLTYAARTREERLAVFSEIHYQPGWKAYLDGEPVEHLRVDWTLRGLRIPAGEHKVEFRFEPDHMVAAYRFGSAASILVLLTIAGLIARLARRSLTGEA